MLEQLPFSRGSSLAVLVTLACAGGPARTPSPPEPAAEPATAPATPTTPLPDDPDVGIAPAPAHDAGAPVAEPAPRSFPPADLTPPHERSAEAGDGRWRPLAKPGDRAAEGEPILVTTTLHPHPESRFISLTVVAVDLARVALHWLPGSEDVGKEKPPFAAGLVPEAERDRLLAVFNGGFQPRHGRWGMKRGELTIMPPRDEGCTVAITKDGSFELRSWPVLSANAARFAAVRQTPPCLVERGELHENLVPGRDKIWGGKTAGIVTRRRSAIGLDRERRVLFYGISIEASPRLLAEGMRHAGAHDAAELDINWNWTRFFLYGKNSDGELRVSSTLVESTYGKSAYVELAQARDFFYLLRR